MSANVAKRRRKVEFDFTGSGLGIMRPTGEVILMLLMFEDENLRPDVLACAARDAGISMDELDAAYRSLE